jgi:hypothetical protein
MTRLKIKMWILNEDSSEQRYASFYAVDCIYFYSNYFKVIQKTFFIPHFYIA